MPTSPYKVKFNMGENATDSNPPIEAGQIVLDKAQDKQCLFVDVDDSTRLQIKDLTKMDKWGSLGPTNIDDIQHIAPNKNTIIGRYVGGETTLPNNAAAIMIPDQNGEDEIGLVAAKTFDNQTSVTTLSINYTMLNVMGYDIINSKVEPSYRIQVDSSLIGISMTDIVLNSIAKLTISPNMQYDGFEIRGVSSPTFDNHAANKQYVDTQVASVQQKLIGR